MRIGETGRKVRTTAIAWIRIPRWNTKKLCQKAQEKDQENQKICLIGILAVGLVK